MLLKFFKQTLPQVIFAIILFSILLWAKSILSGQVSPFYFESISMPFYSIINKWVSSSVLLGKSIAYIMLLFTGFYLLRINSKHIVIKQRTYLLSFFYIILISSIISLQLLNPAILAAFFFVFALDHILSLNHKDVVLDNVFRTGFYIAVASLFYAPAIFYIIAAFLSVISIRSFNVREWFALLFGLITPWFFFFFYHYFINSDILEIINKLKLNLLTEVNNDNSVLLYLFYLYCLLLFIISGFYLAKTISTEKISVRKFHGSFFWFNIVSLFIIIIIPTVSNEILYLAFIPLVFQFTHYFSTSKHKFWPSFLFLLIFALAIFLQFY